MHGRGLGALDDFEHRMHALFDDGLARHERLRVACVDAVQLLGLRHQSLQNAVNGPSCKRRREGKKEEKRETTSEGQPMQRSSFKASLLCTTNDLHRGTTSDLADTREEAS